MIVGVVAGILIGLLLGFAGGGLIYRQSRRWCPECGATTSAERPAAVAAVVQPHSAARLNQGRF